MDKDRNFLNPCSKLFPVYLKIPDGPADGITKSAFVPGVIKTLACPWSSKYNCHCIYHPHQNFGNGIILSVLPDSPGCSRRIGRNQREMHVPELFRRLYAQPRVSNVELKSPRRHSY